MFAGETARNFESGVKTDCKVLELSNWQGGVAIDTGGKTTN